MSPDTWSNQSRLLKSGDSGAEFGGRDDPDPWSLTNIPHDFALSHRNSFNWLKKNEEKRECIGSRDPEVGLQAWLDPAA